VEDARTLFRNALQVNTEESALGATAKRLAAAFERLNTKWIASEEKPPLSELQNDEGCLKCKLTSETDENPMLFCDSCDAAFHCQCLEPVLTGVPEGDWFCPPCVESRPDLKHLLPTEKQVQDAQAAMDRAAIKAAEEKEAKKAAAAAKKAEAAEAKKGSKSRKTKVAAKQNFKKQDYVEEDDEEFNEVLPHKSETLVEDMTIKGAKPGTGLPTLALPETLASSLLPAHLVPKAIQAWDILVFFRSKVVSDPQKIPGCSWADFESMLVKVPLEVENSHIHRFHMSVLEVLYAELGLDPKDHYHKMPLTCYTWPMLLHNYFEKQAIYEILLGRDPAPYNTLADAMASTEYEELSLEVRIDILQTLAELAMSTIQVRIHMDGAETAAVGLVHQKKEEHNRRVIEINDEVRAEFAAEAEEARLKAEEEAALAEEEEEDEEEVVQASSRRTFTRKKRKKAVYSVPARKKAKPGQEEYKILQTIKRRTAQMIDDLDDKYDRWSLALEERNGGIRREMLGMDRNFRKYWVLGDDYTRVLIEEEKEDNAPKWLALTTVDELKALMKSLRKHGKREYHLNESLSLVQADLEHAMDPPPDPEPEPEAIKEVKSEEVAEVKSEEVAEVKSEEVAEVKSEEVKEEAAEGSEEVKKEAEDSLDGDEGSSLMDVEEAIPESVEEPVPDPEILEPTDTGSNFLPVTDMLTPIEKSLESWPSVKEITESRAAAYLIELDEKSLLPGLGEEKAPACPSALLDQTMEGLTFGSKRVRVDLLDVEAAMPEDAHPHWDYDRRVDWRREVKKAVELRELKDLLEEMVMHLDRYFLSKWWTPWDDLRAKKEEFHGGKMYKPMEEITKSLPPIEEIKAPPPAEEKGGDILADSEANNEGEKKEKKKKIEIVPWTPKEIPSDPHEVWVPDTLKNASRLLGWIALLDVAMHYMKGPGAKGTKAEVVQAEAVREAEEMRRSARIAIHQVAPAEEGAEEGAPQPGELLPEKPEAPHPSGLSGRELRLHLRKERLENQGSYVPGQYQYDDGDDDYGRPQKPKRLDGESKNMLADLQVDGIDVTNMGRSRKRTQEVNYAEDDFEDDGFNDSEADDEEEAFRLMQERSRARANRARRAEERGVLKEEEEQVATFDVFSMERTRGRHRRKTELSVEIVDDDVDDEDDEPVKHSHGLRGMTDTIVNDDEAGEGGGEPQKKKRKNLKDYDEMPDALPASFFTMPSRRGGRARVSYAEPEEDEDGIPIAKESPAESPAAVAEEFECEKGCGFDSSDVNVVEEHEKECTFVAPAEPVAVSASGGNLLKQRLAAAAAAKAAKAAVATQAVTNPDSDGDYMSD